MRNIILGDIHGCAGALRDALAAADIGPEDRLILLGDLFDRGPESWEVFQEAKRLAAEMGERFILLRGNHEDYLLRPKLSMTERWAWDRVGRGATVRSFREHGERMEDARPFLEAQCRLYWRGEGLQAVHAGIRTDPVETNDGYTLVHDHDIVLQNQYAGPLTVTGHIALDFPTWFAGDGERAELLPPGEWLPLPEQGVICIDTGCGKGGRLTVMITENGRYRLEWV